jgi:beta-xylosidase
MAWKDDWPVIGQDKDSDLIGEPVMKFKKPELSKDQVLVSPPESDEFDGERLSPQWQWHANPMATWSFLTPEGKLRLYSYKGPDSAKSLWDVPNLLLQKFPAPEFTATTQMTFHPNAQLTDESAGLLVMGMDYAWLGVRSGKDGNKLVFAVCHEADQNGAESETVVGDLRGGDLYLRVQVQGNARCVFSYSTDGEKFISITDTFQAVPGKWIGAKIGLFCTRESQTNDSGYADIDWFRITK